MNILKNRRNVIEASKAIGKKSDEKLKLRIFEHSLIGGDFDGSRVHYRVQDNSPKECMKTR